jgi:hypothetical protein
VRRKSSSDVRVELLVVRLDVKLASFDARLHVLDLFLRSRILLGGILLVELDDPLCELLDLVRLVSDILDAVVRLLEAVDLREDVRSRHSCVTTHQILAASPSACTSTTG